MSNIEGDHQERFDFIADIPANSQLAEAAQIPDAPLTRVPPGQAELPLPDQFLPTLRSRLHMDGIRQLYQRTNGFFTMGDLPAGILAGLIGLPHERSNQLSLDLQNNLADQSSS